jgi:hypothetical protein
MLMEACPADIQAWHEGMNMLRVSVMVPTGADEYAPEMDQIHLAVVEYVPILLLYQGAML